MRLSKLTDKAATIFFWVAGLSIIVILAWFLIQILGGGISHLSWSFITGTPSESTAGGGVGPQLFNSFYILFLSLAHFIAYWHRCRYLYGDICWEE